MMSVKNGGGSLSFLRRYNAVTMSPIWFCVLILHKIFSLVYVHLLLQGGDPLVFKLGHVASLSVQSTSVTDQITEQNVIR
jgi:hypothetical protein